MNYKKIEHFLQKLAGDTVQINEQLDPGNGWVLGYEYDSESYEETGWGDHQKTVMVTSRDRADAVGDTALGLIKFLLSLNNNGDGITGAYDLALDDEVADGIKYWAERDASKDDEWIYVKEITKGGNLRYVIHAQNTPNPRFDVDIIYGENGEDAEEYQGAALMQYDDNGKIAGLSFISENHTYRCNE